MKIRRYLGNNTQEAILKVKMDLGSEALILNTRKVRKKGLLNLFSKPMVEVLAAIDEDYEKRKNQPDKSAETKINTDKKERHEETVIQKDNKNLETEKNQENGKISELEDKVTYMEDILQKIYKHILPKPEKEEIKQTSDIKLSEEKHFEQALTKQNEDKKQIAEKPASLEQEKDSEDLPEVLKVFYENLLNNEVEEKIIKMIIQLVKEKTGANKNINDVSIVLYNILKGIFGNSETIKLIENGKPTVVIFVGPTGVGKTTTLAKIAANFALNQRKSVGLITADTYRIAAVEQLKTYAEILGMPVQVIYSPSEMKEKINTYSDKDLILIDTAGRSHRNKSQFEELKTLIAASQANEVYLVLSATSSNGNCKEIIKNYSFLKDYKLIFTKLDEVSEAGIILNTRFNTKRNLSYVTTGQSVPDDIEVANIDKIIKILLGSKS